MTDADVIIWESVLTPQFSGLIYRVPGDKGMLNGADNIPGKWQILIFHGQQTVMDMQKNNTAASERSCCQQNRGIPEQTAQLTVRICRESLLTESSRIILSNRKGAAAPFSCLPARMGSGNARKRVKGQVPCGVRGNAPGLKIINI